MRATAWAILVCWATATWGAETGEALPSPTTLCIREVATVSGEWVTLGDIALLAPQDAALASVVVAPSPPPGMTRVLTLGFLKVRLRHEGVDIRRTTFTGATKVQVTRERAGVMAELASGSPSVSGREVAPPSSAAVLRRGTVVRLLVIRGPLTVETVGELTVPCAVGEVGRVRVSGTRALVTVRLTSPTTAEVLD